MSRGDEPEGGMSKVNAAWHARHPMPKNPSSEQRLEWHLAHALACRCREMPKRLLAELRARGIEPPPARARGNRDA